MSWACVLNHVSSTCTWVRVTGGPGLIILKGPIAAEPYMVVLIVYTYFSEAWECKQDWGGPPKSVSLKGVSNINSRLGPCLCF